MSSDITAFIDDGSITEREVLQQCDDALIRLNDTNDVSEIAGVLKNLDSIKLVSEKAKVHLTYGLSIWYKDRQMGDDFPSWFASKFGGAESTAKKHELIGEFLADSTAPDEVKHLGVGELIHIARADKSGYDLSDRWEDLQMAADENEVRHIISEIKGKEPRANSLKIYIYKDGSIQGWMNGERKFGGYLNFADRDNPPKEDTDNQRKMLAMMLSRIINNSRMEEK